jgi:hypothetical protein
MSAVGRNLLQNFFAPASEEHFSKTGPEWGILIQETCHLDSDIAHFWDRSLIGRVLRHNREQSGKHVWATPRRTLDPSATLAFIEKSDCR